MRTEVAITIDTEFSIAGAFGDFPRVRPIALELVDCMVDGRSEGLGFLLETFERFGTRATFFVESLNHRYFGDGPMGSVCRRIAAAGQDIQLHVHPCWLAFENGTLLPGKPNDSCAGRTPEDLAAIFKLGLDAFARWGVERPVALRTGSLMVDRAVYRALARLGIPVSSSIGIGIYRPFEPELQLANGRHRLDGLTEVPVTTYRAGSGAAALRTMTVTGCGWPELRSILWDARRAGLENVVILTHPFEYVKTASPRYAKLTRNRVNQGRLESLCAFLREYDQDFAAVSFGERARVWSAAPPAAEVRLAGSGSYALLRKAENAINDRVWAY